MKNFGIPGVLCIRRVKSRHNHGIFEILRKYVLPFPPLPLPVPGPVVSMGHSTCTCCPVTQGGAGLVGTCVGVMAGSFLFHDLNCACNSRQEWPWRQSGFMCAVEHAWPCWWVRE